MQQIESFISVNRILFLVQQAEYTEDAGLPYFDRAAVKANRNWYYASALESMGANLCFRYRSVNIGPSYK